MKQEDHKRVHQQRQRSSWLALDRPVRRPTRQEAVSITPAPPTSPWRRLPPTNAKPPFRKHDAASGVSARLSDLPRPPLTLVAGPRGCARKVTAPSCSHTRMQDKVKAVDLRRHVCMSAPVSWDAAPPTSQSRDIIVLVSTSKKKGARFDRDLSWHSRDVSHSARGSSWHDLQPDLCNQARRLGVLCSARMADSALLDCANNTHVCLLSYPVWRDLNAVRLWTGGWRNYTSTKRRWS